MKRFLYIMSGLFMVSLGIVVGLRMSADAMAVIIGVIFGLLATVPSMVLLLHTLRQKNTEQMQMQQQRQMNQYPPVVVVNSPPNGTNYGAPGNPLNSQPFLSPNNERSFKVVGQDATPPETLGSAFNLSSIWDETN